MKKLLAIAAVTALSATALAEATFGVRGDIVGTNQFTDTTNTTQPGSSYMEAEYARLILKGKISDQLYGRLTLDFLQTGINGLKVAEVDHKMNDMFTLGFGRLQDAGIGGFEGIRAFYDQWIYSQAFQANFPFGVGLEAAITPDHLIKLVVLNQGWTGASAGTGAAIALSSTNQSLSSSQTSPATAQTAYGYGLRYNGMFGSVSAIASYHVDPTYTKNTNNNGYAVVGAMYQDDALKVSLDVLSDTFTGIGTNNNDNGTKSTVVAMADYKMGMWTPRLKVESSTVTDVPSAYFSQNESSAAASSFWGQSFSSVMSGAYTDQISRVDVGTDIRPGGEKDPFYYSVHYVTQSQAFSGNGIPAAVTNKTVTESGIYVSIVAINDILK
jgi:hypothetical protein